MARGKKESPSIDTNAADFFIELLGRMDIVEAKDDLELFQSVNKISNFESFVNEVFKPSDPNMPYKELVKLKSEKVLSENRHQASQDLIKLFEQYIARGLTTSGFSMNLAKYLHYALQDGALGERKEDVQEYYVKPLLAAAFRCAKNKDIPEHLRDELGERLKEYSDLNGLYEAYDSSAAQKNRAQTAKAESREEKLKSSATRNEIKTRAKTEAKKRTQTINEQKAQQKIKQKEEQREKKETEDRLRDPEKMKAFIKQELGVKYVTLSETDRNDYSNGVTNNLSDILDTLEYGDKKSAFKELFYMPSDIKGEFSTEDKLDLFKRALIKLSEAPNKEKIQEDFQRLAEYCREALNDNQAAGYENLVVMVIALNQVKDNIPVLQEEFAKEENQILIEEHTKLRAAGQVPGQTREEQHSFQRARAESLEEKQQMKERQAAASYQELKKSAKDTPRNIERDYHKAMSSPPSKERDEELNKVKERAEKMHKDLIAKGEDFQPDRQLKIDKIKQSCDNYQSENNPKEDRSAMAYHAAQYVKLSASKMLSGKLHWFDKRITEIGIRADLASLKSAYEAAGKGVKTDVQDRTRIEDKIQKFVEASDKNRDFLNKWVKNNKENLPASMESKLIEITTPQETPSKKL